MSSKSALVVWNVTVSREKITKPFLETFHSRYSRERVKRQSWKLMSYAIRPVGGMLIIVFLARVFICLVFFPSLHSFSSIYLSIANSVVSSEGCSSLSKTKLSSFVLTRQQTHKEWIHRGSILCPNHFCFVKKPLLLRMSQWLLTQNQLRAKL